MNISLSFVDSISDAFKEKLQTFADDVLAQGRTANRPPSICFPGMNIETFKKIIMLRVRGVYDRLIEQRRRL